MLHSFYTKPDSPTLLGLSIAKSTERTEILNYRTNFVFPKVITFIKNAEFACPVIIQLEGNHHPTVEVAA